MSVLRPVVTRVARHLAAAVYCFGMVLAAFDAVGRWAWRDWWLRHAASVVAMYERRGQ